MKILRGDDPVPGLRGAIATIGNYDGLHRGQKAVLERVVSEARGSGAPAMVITFDPHPLAVLDPGRAPRRLTSDLQRERLLEAWGIDALLRLRFDRELAALPAEAFVREILVGRLALRALLVGSRFRFGKGRAGDLALLERLGAELGFAVHGLGEVEVGGAPVSATRIRGLLERGEVKGAAELLGRPYAVLGEVVHGAGRGAEIGYPTVNLDSANEILPRYGVYIVEIALEGEAGAHPGVANVGVRPTVGRNQPPVVEAHLLDFDRSCYGLAAEVRFLHRLRSERRFPSFGALRAQIAADVRFAREYFRRPLGSPVRESPEGPSGGS